MSMTLKTPISIIRQIINKQSMHQSNTILLKRSFFDIGCMSTHIFFHLTAPPSSAFLHQTSFKLKQDNKYLRHFSYD